MTPGRSLLASADLIGRERYCELELFRSLGRRSIQATSAQVAVVVSGAARGHAWRAKILEDLLPVSLGLPGVDEATRSPGAELDEAIEQLVAERDDALHVATLAKVFYPAMLAAYRAHLVSCSAISDAPVALGLRRVIADLEFQSDELHAVVGDDEGPPRGSAAEIVRILEQIGGPFGSIG